MNKYLNLPDDLMEKKKKKIPYSQNNICSFDKMGAGTIPRHQKSENLLPLSERCPVDIPIGQAKSCKNMLLLSHHRQSIFNSNIDLPLTKSS